MSAMVSQLVSPQSDKSFNMLLAFHSVARLLEAACVETTRDGSGIKRLDRCGIGLCARTVRGCKCSSQPRRRRTGIMQIRLAVEDADLVRTLARAGEGT